MRALQKQHIVDVYVWVDDSLAKPAPHRGRKPILTDSELLTMLIWDGLTEPHRTLHSLYSWIARDYDDCFPRLPAYQNFVAHCHRLLPVLAGLLQATLSSATPLRFVEAPCYLSAGRYVLTGTK